MLNFADGEAYISTIGVDIKVKTLEVQGKNVKVQIWDTAGQERFAAITSAYYRGAHAIMLVYDLTNHESFDALGSKFYPQVTTHAPENVKLIVVGTMLDKQVDRQVSYEEAM